MNASMDPKEAKRWSVALCLPRYLPHLAGSEVYACRLARLLSAAGWRVVVGSDEAARGPFHIVDIGGVRAEYGIAGQWRPWLRSVRPDFVLTQYTAIPQTVAACIAESIPCGIMCHNEQSFVNAKKWGADRRVALFVWNSEWLRGFHVDAKGLNSVILHPPIDPPDVNLAREPVAITLVNLSREKGADVFYGLAKEFPGETFLGVRGGYGDQVIREVPNVRIQPQTDDMASIYSRTKILLMPSVGESFGMVGVEAQSYGIPVLASDLPGPREAMRAGAIFLGRELSTWSAVLADLLKNKARRDELSRSGLANSMRHVARTPEEVNFLAATMKGIVEFNARSRA